MIADPAAVVAELRGPGPVAWLDGASDADGLGRWSYVGARPAGAVFAWGHRVLHVEGSGQRRWERDDPFEALSRRLRALALPAARAGDPRPFRGGGIGWLGYELGRTIERLPAPDDDTSVVPDLAFWLFPDVLALDAGSGQWHGGTAPLRAALERAAARSLAPLGSPDPVTLQSSFAREQYLEAVARIRAHIRAGDVYQVNLSQRFRAPLREDPFAVYRRLRARRPAPLGAFIESGPRAVLSNSPELFLSSRGGELETRPIKGTRPRGSSPAEDERLRAELEHSRKDAAELTMIVDLMRNDLGKVAEVGSVIVPSLRRLVTLPTVHHLVATVQARLRAGAGAADLLRAAFPGGSVTGCPRIRAMQLLSALEPCRRGVYCGAIGWIAADGDLALNVAIRTATVAHGRVSFHAGGGVVLDSDPESEYQETLDKAQAWLEALGAGGEGIAVRAAG